MKNLTKDSHTSPTLTTTNTTMQSFELYKLVKRTRRVLIVSTYCRNVFPTTVLHTFIYFLPEYAPLCVCSNVCL